LKGAKVLSPTLSALLSEIRTEVKKVENEISRLETAQKEKRNENENSGK